MTYQELYDKLSVSKFTADFFCAGELETESEDGNSYDYFTFQDLLPEYGKVKEVYNSGQHDGCAFTCVVHFIDHDVYMQFTGYYSSYRGFVDCEWDAVKQVFPYQEIVTKYK